MTETESSSRRAAKRIGEHIKRGFLNYVDHWQEWIVPMIVAAALVVLSLSCCLVPYLFVSGPVTCGLYWCALEALRGRRVEAGTLQRGWEKAGSSAIASVFINIGAMLPILLLYGGMALLAVVLALLAQPEDTSSQQNNAEPAAAVAEGTDTDSATPQRTSPIRQGQAKDSEGDVTEPPPPPPPGMVLCMILLMFALYAAMFLMVFLFWIWSLWFTTRMMFVLPLIADRRIGFFSALRRSWAETRVGFWELLAINLVSGVIGTLGMYAMYVGMIFTVPVALTIVASVYEERFHPSPAAAEAHTQ